MFTRTTPGGWFHGRLRVRHVEGTGGSFSGVWCEGVRVPPHTGRVAENTRARAANSLQRAEIRLQLCEVGFF